MKRLQLILLILFFSNIAFSMAVKEDNLFIGPAYSYSNAFASGNQRPLNGVGFSLDGYSKYDSLSLYVKVGFIYNFSLNNKDATSILNSTLGDGVFKIQNNTVMNIPMRILFPIQKKLSDKFSLFFSPGLLVDVFFENLKADVKMYGYDLSAKAKSFGYNMGLAFDVFLRQRITDRMYMKYGIDIGIPLFGLSVVDVTVSGSGIDTSATDANFVTIADQFAFEVIPSISIGYRFK